MQPGHAPASALVLQPFLAEHCKLRFRYALQEAEGKVATARGMVEAFQEEHMAPS
jgi:hypothetical protein